MLLKVFVRNVYFRGYLNETWHAFIVYMFRWRPEVLHSVGDNALISGFGKGPILEQMMAQLTDAHMHHKTSEDRYLL